MPFPDTIYGVPLSLVPLAFFGAALLWISHYNKGRRVVRFFTPFLRESKKVLFLDMLAFSLLGGLIGAIITQPVTPMHSVVSGLGWTGLLDNYLGRPPEEV